MNTSFIVFDVGTCSYVQYVPFSMSSKGISVIFKDRKLLFSRTLATFLMMDMDFQNHEVVGCAAVFPAKFVSYEAAMIVKN